MEKQRWEESEKRREEERISEKRQSQKKEDAGAEKGRTVAILCVQWFVAPKGRKVGSLKPSSQMRDEQLHAVVARSAFGSQNVRSTPFSDHFWNLRCRKSARRCGAKHISKSKFRKHLIFGAFLQVEMSKKCTPLWRDALPSQNAKTHHARATFGSWDIEKVDAAVAWSTHSRSTFGSWHVDNDKVHAVVARSTFPSQKG